MRAPKESAPIEAAESAGMRRARQAGRVAQALFLAALLSLAIMKLLMYAGSSVVFRYQGF